MKKLGVGIVGCGNISGIYFKNCKAFDNLRVVGCADLIGERARSASSEHGVPAKAVDELIASPDVDIVLNLTIPKAHAEINRAALVGGKHVYAEKPLGVSRSEGKATIDLARLKGLRVGCAPDTFLGAGLQTCRKLIDDGAIGRPVSATAFMMCHGHEGWHPNPEFYYEAGGGPMLDMGPYYLTALVSLIGPIAKVSGMTSKAFEERVVGSTERKGTRFPVETMTHIAGLMEFENGAIGTIVTTFDVWAANVPLLEIHGTEGSLSVPDPNGFGGAVNLFRPGKGEWEEVRLSHPFEENSRGLGVADMAEAIEQGRGTRASGELAYHVLDAMEAFSDSYQEGRLVTLDSGVDRPAAMPTAS